MAMSLNLMDSSHDEAEEVNSTINTTPLVDIMLVLLIIFLITIPVVIKTRPVTIPVASNVVTVTTPQNIVIAVDKDGNYFWNDAAVTNNQALLEMLKTIAVIVPQPEVHIRGDKDARFEYIGRIIVDLQRASILKVGFITCPIIVTGTSKC